jgi:biopolymer transport protein ExbB
MGQLLIKGGIMAIPLAICSIVSLVIVVERILFYMRNIWRDKDEREFNLLKQFLRQKKLGEAKTLSIRWNSALGRISETAITQWETDRNLVEKAAQNAGEVELQHFQRGLAILDTIVTASPLLGLLGTVTGIIKSFTALSLTNGGAQSLQLSAGIAEALYNTAFGLAIAIPVLFLVNIFYGIAERTALGLTFHAQELITILQGVSSEDTPAKEVASSKEVRSL